MPTYFGLQIPVTEYGVGGLVFWNNPVWYSFTCPGTGNQIIKELSVYCRLKTGSSNIRVAIYDATGNTLIAQGTAEVAVGAGAAWYGHLTQGDITPNPATLVGGMTYRIAMTADGDSVSNNIWLSLGDDYTGFYSDAAEYTGGFPTPFPLSGYTTLGCGCVRCGVDADLILYYKTLTATSTITAHLLRGFFRTLIATVVTTASIVTGFLYALAMVASSVTTATMTRSVFRLYTQALTAAVATTAALITYQIHIYTQALTATVTTTGNLVKGYIRYIVNKWFGIEV
jgi:hypothetical protein